MHYPGNNPGTVSANVNLNLVQGNDRGKPVGGIYGYNIPGGRYFNTSEPDILVSGKNDGIEIKNEDDRHY